MTPDPPLRRDGRCAGDCGRIILKPKRRRDVPAHLYEDPFCSTECAKAYHGVVMSTYSDSTGLGSTRGRQRTVAA